MAGTIPGFDAEDFRANIRFAMSMGLPNDEAAQPTFYFPVEASADVPLDDDAVPFAPTGTVTKTPSKAPVKVPCAIEDAEGNVVVTALGGMSADRLVLTFLDEDYLDVEGFVFVVIGGVRYDYTKDLTPRALGPVDIHQVLVTGDQA